MSHEPPELEYGRYFGGTYEEREKLKSPDCCCCSNCNNSVCAPGTECIGLGCETYEGEWDAEEDE